MNVWTPNELAMVESAIRAGITPSKCRDWFPGRSWEAIRSLFDRHRKKLEVAPSPRGRPRELVIEEIDATQSLAVMEQDAAQGSRALLNRQLQTGQYFGRTRQQWLERHDRFAA